MTQDSESSQNTLEVVYFFTTFPKATETFLQREVTAMRERGLRLRIYSMWGGGGDFEGVPVQAFNKWRLLKLFWIIPKVAVTEWPFFRILLRGLVTRKPPSWINFWENMLGAGFAGVFRSELAALHPSLIHAAWGGAPATAAWCLHRLDGHRYSAAAHAYDIYEYGGDWWLNEKLAEAAFVHTSTDMGRASLLARGVKADSVKVIRRGLARLPEFKGLRAARGEIRIVCIARLVEKKGLFHQLRIYQRMKQSGFLFRAAIVGDGPLRAELARVIAEFDLDHEVKLLGHLSQAEVAGQLRWADVLFHTGVIAASGDRDGLPNVIPEAMAAGVVVVTSAAAATTEAIQHGHTGLVAAVERPDDWIAAVQKIRDDDEVAERLRLAARAWVEQHFDAHRNAGVLHGLFVKAASGTP